MEKLKGLFVSNPNYNGILIALNSHFIKPLKDLYYHLELL